MFGNNSAFGGQQDRTKPFGGSSGSNLSTSSTFGSTSFGATPSGGVFGSSAGQGVTDNKAPGMFSSSSSGTSMFGASGTTSSSATPSVFGAATTGTTSTPSVFGQSTFGQSQTSTFGSSGTVFGAKQYTATSKSSVFGPVASGGITSTFGQQTKASSVFGGNSAKSGTSTNAFGGSVFGGTGTTQPATLFASTANTFSAPLSTGPAVFGSSSTSEQNTSNPFGGATGSNIFGASATNVSSNIFGGSTTSNSNMFTAPTAPSGSVFGSASTTSSNMFGTPTTAGSNVFGAPMTTSGSVFGGPVTTSANVFGTTMTTSGNVFGTTATTSANVFGTTAPTSGNMFGTTATTSANVFGTTMTTSGNVFGTTVTTSGNVFGSPVTATGNPFGAPITTTSNVFGGPRATSSNAFGTSVTTSGNLFSGSVTTSGKAFSAPVTTSSNVFGAPTTTSDNVFGTLTTPASNEFGATATTSSSVFGGSATTGTNIFGGSTSQTGSVFGGSTPGASSVFGGQSTKSTLFGATGATASNTHGASSGVFGATQPTGVGNTSSQQSTSSSFRSVRKLSAGTATSVFGGKSGVSSTSESGSFGLTSSEKDTGATGIFANRLGPTPPRPGRSEQAESGFQDSFATFAAGADKRERKVLFGKLEKEEVSEEERQRDADQSSEDKAAANVFGADRKVIARSPRKVDRPGGLFGRALTALGGSRSSKQSPERKIETKEEARVVVKREPGTEDLQTEGEQPRETASKEVKSKTGIQRTIVRGDSMKDATPRRRLSLDEVSTKTAIVCRNVPNRWNKKESLRSHFSRFGKVVRVNPNPKRQAATIHFADHVSADNAKRRGRSIRGTPAMDIFWSRASGKEGALTSPTDPEAPVTRSGPQSSTSKSAARLAASDDVDDELASMRGTADVEGEAVTFLKRPKESSGRPAPRSFKQKSAPPGDDLDDELASMRGTADIEGEVVTFLKRPEETSKKGAKPGRSGKETGPSMRASGSKDLRASPVRQKLSSGRPTSPHRLKVATERPASPHTQSTIKAETAGTGHISLKHLTDAVGHNVHERYLILDNLDKLLRQGRKKQQDLATATAMKGTCPDMCPEKERYVREDRRRLSAYEIVPGTDLPGQNPKVDHARAVKEYSRSSADQDMPLPHELRPPAVLRLTMDYLMNNIMDLGEDGKWGDYYEFLWDRTRGIRKDITQQQLCDGIAGDLLEKCTRWHIYCAGRLCEEDMAIFDMKINNENLTKCLQSLKELYHDLAFKQNVKCPNEAEFRAYMVLMNLNEGDTLREVQQLREEVRQSAQLKFALEVYATLNSNNYVKFFKHVQQASFLNACILHRYFNQVRSRALNVMQKAYGMPGRPTQFPVAELTRQLWLEDMEEVVDFCEHHALELQQDLINFGRATLVDPEVALAARRAKRLIESKLQCSVGEVVNGGPLPLNVIHTPVSSFDENGRLKNIKLELMQEEGGGAMDIPAVPTPAASTADTKPKKFLSIEMNEHVKDIAKQMFVEIIKEEAIQISQSLTAAITHYLSMDTPITDQLIDETTEPLTRTVADEVLMESREDRLKAEEAARQEQQARQRAEAAAMRDKVAREEVEGLLTEVIQEQARAEAATQHRAIQDTLKQQSVERSTDAISSQLLNSCVDREILLVAQEVFQVDVTERLQELAEKQRAVELMRTGRFLVRWKNEHARRLRLQRGMLKFPSAPSMETGREQLHRLVPESQGVQHTDVHLGKHAYLTLLSPGELQTQMRRFNQSMFMQAYLKQLQCRKAWSPLDVVGLVGTRMANKMPAGDQPMTVLETRHLFWKLLLWFPDFDPEAEEMANEKAAVCHDWLRAKFERGSIPQTPQRRYTSELVSLYTAVVDGCLAPCSLSVCVRVGRSHHDVVTDQDDPSFVGLSGIIYPLPPPPEDGRPTQEYWIEQSDIVQELCNSQSGDKPVPVVVLSRASQHPDTVCRLLGQGRVTGPYSPRLQVLNLDNDVEDLKASAQLQEAVRWLADSSPGQPQPPWLQSLPLRDLMEDALAAHFYPRIYQDLATRRQHRLPHQRLDILIQLYNSVVKQGAWAASSPALRAIPSAPPEVTSIVDVPASGWNEEGALQMVRQHICSLQLPLFAWHTVLDADWPDLCDQIIEYILTVTESEALYSRVRWLLRKAREDYEELLLWTSATQSGPPDHRQVPWTPILEACIDAKLSALYAGEESSYGGQLVYYRQEDLDSFSVPECWKEATRRQPLKESPGFEKTISRAEKRKLQLTGDSVSTGFKSARADDSTSTHTLDIEPLSQDYVQACDVAHTLRNHVAKERQHEEAYMEFLQNALDSEGALSPPTTNLLMVTPRPQPLTPDLPYTSAEGTYPGAGTQLEDCQLSLDEKLTLLKSEVKISQNAEKLYEMKLQSLLMEPFHEH